MRTNDNPFPGFWISKSLISKVLFILSLSLLAIPLSSRWTCAEKEDTAYLSLTKIALLKAKTSRYVVKKGDTFFEILRKEAGITSHRVKVARILNPDLKNVNKIYPGQVVVIPRIEPIQKAESLTEYKVKKGDSLTRIAVQHLHATSKNLLSMVNEIKRLNPRIKNVDKIYPGQTIVLPKRSFAIATQEEELSKPTQPEDVKEKKTKEELLPQGNLEVIDAILRRMNGSLVRNGYYYIPLPSTGEVTIDCSLIPVAELDDGSTILIDFFNHIPEPLKHMISQNWKDYHVIRASIRDDTIATVLNKILDASRLYTMTKANKPLLVTDVPSVSLVPDWLITKKTSREGKPFTMAIFFVSDDAHLLPAPLIHYTAKRGVVITEIVAHRTVVTPTDVKSAAPEIASIVAPTNLDLAHLLMNQFGYVPEKDKEIGVYSATTDGINVTLRTDMVVTKEKKRILFFSKKIPQQFIDKLKSGGDEVLIIEDGEQRRATIEKVLGVLNIPFSAEKFTFSFPEKVTKPQCTITFSAIKVTQGKEKVYLTDFEMDRDIYMLLHNTGGVKVIRY